MLRLDEEKAISLSDERGSSSASRVDRSDIAPTSG